MAVFQQCPICRTKQKTSLKKCRSCGEGLIKAKKSGKIKYWTFNYINKKYHWKCIGTSIVDAQDADSEIRLQKRKNPYFDLKDNHLTFAQLTEWYTGLISVQKKKYYPTLLIRFTKWNNVYGDKPVIQLRKSDVENYQIMRLDEGFSRSTIDQEVGAARTMIQAAIDDDRIDGDCIKPFRKVSKLLKNNSNARDKVITHDQLLRIIERLPEHLHGVVSLGYFSGMRLGEILGLTWDKVNLQHDIPHIKLEEGDTKEGKEKIIPLAGKVQGNPLAIIKGLPRGLRDTRVFWNGERLVDRKHVNRYLEKACMAVPIAYGRFKPDGFIFHDLRHCFNTNMRRAGVDQLTIMTIMGHSPGRGFEMTYRYSTFDLADLGRAVGVMEKYLIGQNIREEIN